MIVLSVAIASFMVRLNNYTVNVSLPTIAEYFDVGTGQVSRIVMSYLLIITSTLLLFGKLGDRIGLKKVFTTGYIIFVAGSLLCGLSRGIHELIGARVIQGLGGSMILATSFAIISRYLPPRQKGMGLWYHLDRIGSGGCHRSAPGRYSHRVPVVAMDIHHEHTCRCNCNFCCRQEYTCCPYL